MVAPSLSQIRPQHNEARSETVRSTRHPLPEKLKEAKSATLGVSHGMTSIGCSSEVPMIVIIVVDTVHKLNGLGPYSLEPSWDHE